MDIPIPIPVASLIMDDSHHQKRSQKSLDLVKLHKCEICEKTFASERNRKLHKQYAHQATVEELTKKRFSMQYLPKVIQDSI